MSEPVQSQQRLLIVTGPAGAGRTTALKALEDLGVEVIDNLPMSLLPHLAGGPTPTRPLAFGIDTRNRDFSAGTLLEMAGQLSARPDLDVQLLYLDCSEDVLLRRYSETRRRHPLSEGETLLDGIRHERDLLSAVRDAADYLIDTSDLTVHDTRAEIDNWFAPGEGRRLAVQLQSFSYKRGLPRGLDMVFDVRFLRNPHWQPDLRPLDGRNAQVAAHVSEDPLYPPFFARVLELIRMLLPAYKDEGKSYLTIGFGCSGGQHRSVALTEAMSKALAEAGWQVSIRHRELERRQATGPAGSQKEASPT